jgi:hypothetical protein
MPLYAYFICTLLIELPIVLLLLKGTNKEKLLIAFLLNLFTYFIASDLCQLLNINLHTRNGCIYTRRHWLLVVF